MSGGQLASSGRGGAGNMVDPAKSPKTSPTDLETPTLKTNMVTTGRGGAGNMTPNVDPAETRALQDVEPVVRREDQGAQHSGRGGAGNIINNKGKEHQHARQTSDDSTAAAAAAAGDKLEGLAAKGKALLFGKKDKHGPDDGPDVKS